MKQLPLLVFVFTCTYVSGAPNLFENDQLQSRINSELKEEQPIQDANIQKPLPLFRKETANDSKRKRCENCMNLKRCKMHQMCEICNVFCKDIDVSQLHTPEAGVVGYAPEDAKIDNEYSTATSNSLSSNSDRFYTVDNIKPGPKHNILARILNIPKKDDLGNLVILEQPKENLRTNESPVIIDTANVFKKNDDSELNAEIIPVGNNQVKPELRSKIEKEVNMAVEEKKRLLNDSKLSKDELGQIINHAKTLLNRKSNREGLLHLRSRSILNKDNNETSTDSSQGLESSRERPLLGNKLIGNKSLLKGKNSSIGLRRKFNISNQSNLQEIASAEKDGNQQEPEEVKLPIMEISSTTEVSLVNQQEFDVLQLKHKPLARAENEDIITRGNFLTPEKFGLILKSLEDKVESIADLVRRTCRQPTPTDYDTLQATKSNMPIIKKLESSEVPTQAENIHENPAQNDQNELQKQLVGLNDDEAEDQEDNLESVSKTKDNEQESLNIQPNASNDSEQPINHSPNVHSKFGMDDKKIITEPKQEDEQQPISQNVLASEPNAALAENKPVETSNGKKSSDEGSQDKMSTNEDSKTSIYKPNHNLFNTGSRYAEKPFYKHRYFTQDPIEMENPLFDRSAAHANPHTFLREEPSLDNIEKDEIDDDVSHLRTPTPALKQRFAENEGDNKESTMPFDAKDDEPDATNQFGILGKIVPQDPKSNDKVMFVSDSMKLPFNIKKNPDGSYQVSVDTEKLCPSCNSGMCKSTISGIEQPKLGHIIAKRDVPKPHFSSTSFSNLHKKRKPFPSRKKKLLKTKRSTNLDSELKMFPKHKFLNNFLTDDFDKKKNIFSDDDFQDENKIEKQNVDVTQQRIDLINNLLTWWKNFVQDQA